MLKGNEKERIKLSFEYLYWFSRFEYTLKENTLVQTDRFHNAQPNWNKFIEDYSEHYLISDCAKELIILKPYEQKFIDNSLVWNEINLNIRCDNNLDKVVLLLKTARNNLFHGGKHSQEIENIDRDINILKVSIIVIKELAGLESFGAEIFEPYQGFDLNEVF